MLLKLFELNDRFISTISTFQVELSLKAKINLQGMIKSGKDIGYAKRCTCVPSVNYLNSRESSSRSVLSGKIAQRMTAYLIMANLKTANPQRTERLPSELFACD